MSSSIGIQKDFFLFNHWPRYERSREVPIWNGFQIILFGVAVRFVYVFSSPSRLIHIKNKERIEEKDKIREGRAKFF
jgi:hypothetical protein